ncbi:MAG: B-box zinc finger protein, partial [Chloroflexi bacterium]|nr:B-box zinc finger protein [Chloroflexota bacterium]
MTDATLRCGYHPDRETTLRCNRCEKPICTKCAVLTPVGYRCKECVRGQQSVFETARTSDFVIAAVVSAVGVGIAVALLNIIGFWGFFVAPIVGGGLAEIVRA